MHLAARVCQQCCGCRWWRRAAPDRRYADHRLVLTNRYQRRGRCGGGDDEEAYAREGVGHRQKGGRERRLGTTKRALGGNRRGGQIVSPVRRTRTRPSPCRRHESRDNCLAQLTCPDSPDGTVGVMRSGRKLFICGSRLEYSSSLTPSRPVDEACQVARDESFPRYDPLFSSRRATLGSRCLRQGARLCPVRVSGGCWTRTRERKQQGRAFTNNTALRDPTTRAGVSEKG